MTTLSKRLTKEERRELSDLEHEVRGLSRPQTRAQCGTERPCPWVSCRYHLAIDVNPRTGGVQLNYQEDLSEMRESCALDVAEQGGLTLEAVGALLGVTRERTRQMESHGLLRLRENLNGSADEWRLFLDLPPQSTPNPTPKVTPILIQPQPEPKGDAMENGLATEAQETRRKLTDKEKKAIKELGSMAAVCRAAALPKHHTLRNALHNDNAMDISEIERVLALTPEKVAASVDPGGRKKDKSTEEETPKRKRSQKVTRASQPQLKVTYDLGSPVTPRLSAESVLRCLLRSAEDPEYFAVCKVLLKEGGLL